MEELRIRNDFIITGNELEETASRSGGSGGQHVNKTSSRVTLRWNVLKSQCVPDYLRERLLGKLKLTTEGDLILHVDQHRSQLMNRELARERLTEILTAALVLQTPRRATKPTRSSQKTRVEGKKRDGQLKKGRSKGGWGD